jgi:epoxyqueuosine reductase
MKNIFNEIEKKAIEMGAFKVAIADISNLKMEKYSKYKSAISFIIPLGKGIMEKVENSPTYEYFHHYRSVNRLIDDITLKTTFIIEKSGFRAYPIAASQSVKGDYEAAFSHKMAGTISGAGWIGKSALFVTKEHGPRVRLGTVLTDIDFENYGIPITESSCGNCNICVEKCPALAITGENWNVGMRREEIFDAKACSDYMKNKFKDIGRGAVCGICVRYCPYSKV